MIENTPLVSVIATSYGIERLEDLKGMLDSLERQTYPQFELIIVLEKSRELFDEIASFIRQKGYSHINVIFSPSTNGASAARNIGVRKARGDFLAFIDDDAVATTSWLVGIIDAFRNNPDAVGVTGPILPLWESDDLKWLPEEFYWIVSCNPASSEQAFEVRNAWGNNMSFRREAFEKAGLFRTSMGARGGGVSGKHELVGEDTEFSIRARQATGGKIICSPQVVVYHRACGYRFGGKYVVRRSYWEGYTKVLFKKASRKQPGDALDVEHKLLRRILMRLLPRTVRDIGTNPPLAWKRLRLIALALLGIGGGYARGIFVSTKRLGGKECLRVLVTGGAGFIGSHLIDRLLAEGNEVICCDNLSSGRIANLEKASGNANFGLIEMDLKESHKLEEALRGCHTVFHVAAHADVRSGTGNTRIDLENGTMATYNVLEAMRRGGVKEIVYASSASVYGETPPVPMSENYGPLLPVSLYGASKLAAEGLISAYCHTFDLRGWMFRFANIVGARRRQGVVYDFVHRLRQNPCVLEVLGNGSQCKPYLHVSECVDGILYGHSHAGERVNLFNIGVDSATSVRDIADIVIEEMQLSAVRVIFGSEDRGWPGDAPQLRFDMSRMKALGWCAKLSSAEAVHRAAREHIAELC